MGTNISEIWIKIYTFSFKKMHLKMLSGKWWPFCLCLNMITTVDTTKPKHNTTACMPILWGCRTDNLWCHQQWQSWHHDNSQLSVTKHSNTQPCAYLMESTTGLILGLRPANERCRYKVTASLIGWAQTWNQPWNYTPLIHSVTQSTIHEWISCSLANSVGTNQQM